MPRASRASWSGAAVPNTAGSQPLSQRTTSLQEENRLEEEKERTWAASGAVCVPIASKYMAAPTQQGRNNCPWAQPDAPQAALQLLTTPTPKAATRPQPHRLICSSLSRSM